MVWRPAKLSVIFMLILEKKEIECIAGSAYKCVEKCQLFDENNPRQF